jgi:PAS domain S-box-containing protein
LICAPDIHVRPYQGVSQHPANATRLVFVLPRASDAAPAWLIAEFAPPKLPDEPVGRTPELAAAGIALRLGGVRPTTADEPDTPTPPLATASYRIGGSELHASIGADAIAPSSMPPLALAIAGTGIALLAGLAIWLLGLARARASAAQSAHDQVRQQLSARNAAEQHAAATERQAAIVLDGITDGVIVVDRAYRIEYANSAARRMLAAAASDPVGCRLSELFPRFAGSAFEASAARAFDSGSAQSAETHSRTLARWLECRFYPCADQLTLVFHDVSERRRLRQIERAENETLAGIGIGEPLSATLTRLVRNFEQQFKDAICSILRYDATRGQLFGGIAPSLPPSYNAAFEAAAVGPQACSCGTAVWRRERVVVEDIASDPLWVGARELALPLGLAACWSQPVLAADGTVLGTFAVYHREVRGPRPEELAAIERAASIAAIALGAESAREQLRSSEQRFRSLFDQHPNAAFAMDLEGHVLAANSAAVRLSGVPREVMLGNLYDAMIDELQRSAVRERFHAAARGEAQSYETVGVRADGERRTVHVTNLPIVVDGRIEGVYGIARDITEEARRRDEERVLRNVIELSPAVLWRYRYEEGATVVELVTANVSRFGYQPEQFVSASIYYGDLIHPDDRPRLRELWDRRIAEGATEIESVYRLRRADGAWAWIDERTRIERDASGVARFFLGLTLDVTERELTRVRLVERDRFFSLAPLAFCISDGAGYYQQVNRTYCDLLGYTEQELYSRPIAEFIHPDDRERARIAKAEMLRLGSFDSLQIRMLHHDGSSRWFEWRGLVAEHQMLFVTGRDVTQLRMAEEEQQLLRQAIEQSAAVLWRWSWDEIWSVRYVSGNVRQWGYEPGDFASAALTYRDLVHPDDTEALRQQVLEVAAGRRAMVEAIYRIRTSAGHWVWVDERSGPVRDSNAAVLYWQGLTIDVTAHQLARQRLAERDRFFELSQEIFAISGPDGYRRQANKAMARVLGYTTEELCARPWEEFLHPDDRAIVSKELPLMRLTDDAPSRASEPQEFRYIAKDGSIKVLSLIGAQDENGFIHIAGRDVTELARVREEQRVLRRVIEQSPVVLWRWRGAGFQSVEYVSENVRQWGYEAAEFTRDGRLFDSIVQPDDRELLNAEVDRAIAAGAGTSTSLYRIVTRDGRELWVDDRTTIVRDARGQVQYLEGVTIDVTAREEARARLAQRDRFFDLSLELFMISERNGRIRQASPTFHRLLGLADGTLQQLDWHVLVHPDDHAETLAMFGRLLAGAVVEGFRIRLMHRDGSARWIEWSGTLAHDGNVYATGRDVTQAVAVAGALSKALADLRVRNRELEDFAYVASHDLQEPLRKIRMFADRIAGTQRARLDRAGSDYLLRIDNAATRMQELIDGLLSYSRTNFAEASVCEVDLDKIAAEVVDDLEAAIESSGAELSLGQLPKIHADPTQMRQVFQNLIGNALKFTAPGRRPHVAVNATLAAPLPGDDRARVVLEFRDNGIGFEPAQADRIFAPFARLHDRGSYKGTGIGLSIVRKIVERHGGSITASARPGEGATFTLELPLLPLPSLQADADRSMLSAPLRGSNAVETER